MSVRPEETGLDSLPPKLPNGVILEKPPFVPQLVLTPQLQAVMRDVMHQWKHREKFASLIQYGIRPLDRLLFYGPPGNGKTMACYWMSRKLEIPIYRVLCNQLHSKYCAETTHNVADVMDYLNRRVKPAIVLWDEVEAIFTDRKSGQSATHQELGAALTVFLQSLDRWKAPILLVMATNLREHLDDALLSRIEMQIQFTGPDVDQCESMLQYWGEILCDHGSEEWAPVLRERMREQPAESFRHLQQMIAYAAREWIARKCGEPK